MKKYVIEFALCLIAATTILCTVKGCFKAHEEVRDMTAIGSVIQYDSAKHYRDLWKIDHALVQQQQGDIKALKAFHGKAIDSLCRRFNIREKQLQTANDVLAKAQGVIEAPVKYIHDTIPGTDTPFTGQYFTYSDSNLTMTGYVDSSKATVFYSLGIHLNVSTYWKRRWFLGKKRYYVDAFSPNDNIHIYGLTGLKIN